MSITSNRDAQNRIVINDGVNSIAFSETEIIELHDFAESNLAELNRELDAKANQKWVEFNSGIRRVAYDNPLSPTKYNAEVRRIDTEIAELQASTKTVGRVAGFEIEICLTPLAEVIIRKGESKLNMGFAVLATEHESIETRRRHEKLERRFELFGAVGLVGSR